MTNIKSTVLDTCNLLSAPVSTLGLLFLKQKCFWNCSEPTLFFQNVFLLYSKIFCFIFRVTILWSIYFKKILYLFNKFTLKNVCIIQTNCTFIHIFHKTNTRFNSFIFCCQNFHLFKVFTCFSLVFFAQCYTQQRPIYLFIYLFIYFLVSLEYINLVRQYIDQ